MSGTRDEEERRQKTIKLASALAFLAVVVVAVLIVVSQSGDSGGGGDASSVDGIAEIEAQLSGIPQKGLVLGSGSAKAQLIEFGDLQCPVCKAFADEILPPIVEGQVRNGEARLEFRNFTIISQESITAGAAAVAAGQQARGWNFVELFYRNQGIEASGYVTDEFLTSIAKAAKVPDIDKWDKARKSGAVISEVEASTEEADKLGFNGTPSFAIEGPGASGLETLGTPQSTGAIEEAIAAAG